MRRRLCNRVELQRWDEPETTADVDDACEAAAVWFSTAHTAFSEREQFSSQKEMASERMRLKR